MEKSLSINLFAHLIPASTYAYFLMNGIALRVYYGEMRYDYMEEKVAYSGYDFIGGYTLKVFGVGGEHYSCLVLVVHIIAV